MRRVRRSLLSGLSKRRAERLVLACVRASFRILALLPAALSARWAEVLFLKPPRQLRTRAEGEILSRGRVNRIRYRGREVAVWRWGEGPPVLLVHGWGGHAGRLGRFVKPLTEVGFSVIGFDAPGHGRSSGRLCDLTDFVGSLRAVYRWAARAGNPVAAVVGHSLGAAASALAIRKGLRVRAAVLLAPLADPEEYTGRFATICRMPVRVRDTMKERLALRQGLSWEKLRLTGSFPSGSAPLLIFHDRNDLKVPFKNGRAIAAAWPGADLVPTLGLGHHKILRDAQVVAGTVAFLRRCLRAPARALESREIA